MPRTASCSITKVPTRGETFVSRQISQAVALIEVGLQQKLYLGNLDAKRDSGHARDYVEGMWLMLQQPQPDDYVLATGEAHSVREFVEKAFARGPGKRSSGVALASKRRGLIGHRAERWSRSTLATSDPRR